LAKPYGVPETATEKADIIVVNAVMVAIAAIIPDHTILAVPIIARITVITGGDNHICITIMRFQIFRTWRINKCSTS